MSSSKIQEYNLDPNMGLAKESTSQQILGLLSNDGSNTEIPSLIKPLFFPNTLEKFSTSIKGNVNGTTGTITLPKNFIPVWIYHYNTGLSGAQNSGGSITIDGVTYSASISGIGKFMILKTFRGWSQYSYSEQNLATYSCTHLNKPLENPIITLKCTSDYSVSCTWYVEVYGYRI